jgi:peptide/nickel transport system permease protein
MDIKLLFLQRLASLLFVMIGASILIFVILRVLPGDPVATILGVDATPEAIKQLRSELGLDLPLPVQYLDWIRHALIGDLGNSYNFKMPVWDLLADRFPRTLILSLVAMLVALAVAIPAGIVSATHKSGLIDHLSRIAALAGTSMPSFWLGLMLIFLFGVHLRLFPTGGFIWPTEDFWGSMHHLVLPALTLGAAFAGTIMRMLRSSMLDVLQRDYILSAKASGIKQRTIIGRDALRNALIPTMTVSGFAFGAMLSGTVLTEVIFNIPGIGRLLYEAILSRDYPLVQGVVLLNIVLFIGINFIVDILYYLLDPRIRA